MLYLLFTTVYVILGLFISFLIIAPLMMVMDRLCERITGRRLAEIFWCLLDEYRKIVFSLKTSIDALKKDLLN